jgi:hypothetical protein
MIATMNAAPARLLCGMCTAVPPPDAAEAAAAPVDVVGEGAAGLYVLVAVAPPVDDKVVRDEVLPLVVAASTLRQVLYE